LSLFGVHAHGSDLGGATSEQEESLAQYGRDLGMAFQIVDDVLDLTASQNVLGKPVASDLREGKVTMAVIHALERCTAQERKSIETVLQERAFEGVTHREIIAILERYGSLEAANARAMQYATLARNAFAVFRTARLSGRCCGRRNSLSPGRSEEDRCWSLVG